MFVRKASVSVVIVTSILLLDIPTHYLSHHCVKRQSFNHLVVDVPKIILVSTAKLPTSDRNQLKKCIAHNLFMKL